MTLAIFDLDNTLLRGDSDYAWGQFLIEQHIVDGETYERENQRYYDEYRAGTLDIFEFLAFTLRPLADHDRTSLDRWHQQFMQQKTLPMITPATRELVDMHRTAGDTLVVITATNSFITGPIAAELGIPHLIATEPEMVDGRFTGRVSGTPCFREGKVQRLREWLDTNGGDLNGSWFYSDSHNDLPLLQLVERPVAVNPDPTLLQHAQARRWPVITLQ